ncbi:MAG: hypothetical protein K2X87_25490 [Gemmataceae bacterium]|nr:hypothetical protein [Gemmataceae bacterium]
MKTYTPKPPRRPRADDDYHWRWSDAAWEPGDGGPASLTVMEQEPDTFSGLLDADGNELHRERVPMGFALTRN